MLQTAQTSKERAATAPTMETSAVASEAGEGLQPYGNAALQDEMKAPSVQAPTAQYTIGAGSTIRGTTFTAAAPAGAYTKLTGSSMRIVFLSALLLDSRWPVSNLALSELTIDLETGTVTSLQLKDTQDFALSSGKAEAGLRTQVTKSLSGVTGSRTDDPFARMSAVIGALVGPSDSAPARDGAGGAMTLSKAIESGDARVATGTTLQFELGLDGDKVTDVGLRSLQLDEKGVPSVLVSGAHLTAGGIRMMSVKSLKPMSKLGALTALAGIFGSLAVHNGDLSKVNPEWAYVGDEDSKVTEERARTLLQAVSSALVGELRAAVPQFDWSDFGP